MSAWALEEKYRFSVGGFSVEAARDLTREQLRTFVPASEPAGGAVGCAGVPAVRAFQPAPGFFPGCVVSCW